ncbi:MAG: PQQ-like beta-propeller repeat protein [Myxococcales bacterium]|nr:PQQ-like beta-propeller repeat protein [Myxococcales bacterium]
MRRRAPGLSAIFALALACAPHEAPPPRAAAPDAASAPAPALAPTETIELSLETDPMPLAWTLPVAHSGWPTVNHGLVLVEDGAVVRRRVETGELLWRSALPEGTRWRDVAAGPRFVIAVGSRDDAPGQTQLAGFDAKTGMTAWRRAVEGAAEVARSEHGVTVLERDPGCRTSQIDPRTGADLSPERAGLRYERRPLKGGQPYSSCQPAMRPLGALVRTRGEGGRVTAERWDDGALELSESFIHDVVYGSGHHPWLGGRAEDGLRIVSVFYGRRGWTRDWSRGEAPGGCDGEELGTLRAAVLDEAYPLARQCGRARLYDPETGETLWERESVATPLIAGERSRGGALPLPSYGERPVQWFSEAGEPGRALTIPLAAREVYTLPDGLLIVEDDAVRFEPREPDGPRWRLAIQRSNLVTDGWRWVAIQDQQEPRGQLVVDAQRGVVVGSIENAFVLGFADGYLVLRRAEGDALLSARLPG